MICYRVWGDTIDAIDCGDESATWLNSYLGSRESSDGYRLIFHQSDLSNRRCDEGSTRWHKKARPEDQVLLRF